MSNLFRARFLKSLFKREDVDYSGVVVPLDQASHRASVVSEKSESDSNSSVNVGLTTETLKAEIEKDLAANDQHSAYDRKSKVINRAIQDMGMGKYQWHLFVLCGFGWLADNLWLQGVALTLPQIAVEFNVSTGDVRYSTLALFLGLCIGACFWGTGSDILGRRLAFNATLCIAGVFGIAAGGGPNWVGVSALYACIGLGVGGNLPVDGALFLEFLPYARGNMLTLLSVFWPIGQLISSLAAWGLIPNYSCPDDLPAGQCTKEENMGWRYFIFTLGGFTFLMFLCRFALFNLYESPKFLLSRGRQREAVHVVHAIAHYNKTTTWITEDILNQIGGDPEVVQDGKLSTMQIIQRSVGKFSTQRIAPLFSTRKLGVTTCLLWFQWTTIGMAYPLFNAFLPQYLANSGSSSPTATSIVYRNYAITSIVGVPGSIIGAFCVDLRYLGRKGTMAIATLITGIFLFCFTISTNPDYQLGFTCLEALFQNVMYGVLYAYTPEVFPAPNRGTGTGICSFLNRVAGLCAPIVAINAGSANPKAPIYASGGLIMAAFVSMIFLPIETRGKQTL